MGRPSESMMVGLGSLGGERKREESAGNESIKPRIFWTRNVDSDGFGGVISMIGTSESSSVVAAVGGVGGYVTRDDVLFRLMRGSEACLSFVEGLCEEDASEIRVSAVTTAPGNGSLATAFPFPLEGRGTLGEGEGGAFVRFSVRNRREEEEFGGSCALELELGEGMLVTTNCASRFGNCSQAG